MSAPMLLVVRCPADVVDALRRVPGMAEAFRVQSVGQTEGDMLRDWPSEDAEAVAAFYAELARSCWVTHAIVAQPLHWYAEAAARALRAAGVSVFYLEKLVDRIVLDPLGCQYTASNECVRFADVVRRVGRPATIAATRYAQPADVPAADLHARFGGPDAVSVIYTQVPGDMALATPDGGMSYAEFLAAVIEGNPGERFVVKQHPQARTELPDAPNVAEVDASVHSLFAAYPIGAAYSSTVIYEGVARGCVFGAGGRHIMLHSAATINVRDRAAAAGLPHRLRALHKLSRDPRLRERVESRVAFVRHVYTLEPDEADVLRRILTPPAQSVAYYARRARNVRRGTTGER